MVDKTAPNPSISSSSVTAGDTVTVSINDAITGLVNSSSSIYSLISPSSLTSTQVSSRMSEAVSNGTNHKAPYVQKEDNYYVYGIYNKTQLATDKAGNVVACDLDVTYNSTAYCVVEFRTTISPVESSTTTGIVGVESAISENTEVNSNQYGYQLNIGNTGKMIVIQINNSVDCNLNTIVSAYATGLTIVGELSTSCDSDNHENVIIKYNNSYEYVDVLVINTTPRINASNAGATLTVNKGEEVSNIGLSFTSVDGEALEVDTLITLDGVKVKEIDTNIPGVYNVRQMAVDKHGKKTSITKKIVVLDNAIQEEIVTKEEEIEVVEEILVPVVHNTNVESEVNTHTTTKVVEEVLEVEMRIEKKNKVKGYQKRKEIRKTKKEKFSFKLFSKYFFKIYDG